MLYRAYIEHHSYIYSRYKLQKETTSNQMGTFNLNISVFYNFQTAFFQNSLTFPDFHQISKFPDFSLQGIYFAIFPVFPVFQSPWAPCIDHFINALNWIKAFAPTGTILIMDEFKSRLKQRELKFYQYLHIYNINGKYANSPSHMSGKTSQPRFHLHLS